MYPNHGQLPASAGTPWGVPPSGQPPMQLGGVPFAAAPQPPAGNFNQWPQGMTHPPQQQFQQHQQTHQQQSYGAPPPPHMFPAYGLAPPPQAPQNASSWGKPADHVSGCKAGLIEAVWIRCVQLCRLYHLASFPCRHRTIRNCVSTWRSWRSTQRRMVWIPLRPSMHAEPIRTGHDSISSDDSYIS